MRSDLFQRSKTSPRPYVWLRRLSMLAVLSASEGVGVIFFSSIPYVLNDNTGTKNYADIAAEAMRYTVPLECAR